MKNLKAALVVILLTVCIGKSNAQLYYKFLTKMRETPWVIGGGWNVVHDDGGKWFKNLLKVDKVWNMPAYPSRLTCEKVLDKEKGWSVELMLAYNRYGSGNYLSDAAPETLVATQWTLFSADVMGKYDFNKLYDLNALMFGDQEIFQPFGTFGFGYTYRSMPRFPNTVTFNLGLGFNAWIYEGWGVQIQSLSKFGLKSGFPTSGSNYLQHSIGVVYKFQPKSTSLGKRYKAKKVSIRKTL